jgi:hypothetical protein
MHPVFFAVPFVVTACTGNDAGTLDPRLERLEGFWTSIVDLEPYEPSMIATLPEGTHLLTDTGNVPELPLGDYMGLELTQHALDEANKFDPSAQRSPSDACDAPSVVYFMQAPFPMEVHATQKVIVMKMEFYDQVRLVFLDSRPHPPEEIPHSRVGHSVGRWEKDTLVVETTHIRAGTFFNNGFRHSESIRLTERFRVSPDGNTLWITQVYEDPESFVGRAARYMAFAKEPSGGYVFPYECNPDYTSGYSLR